MTHHLVMACSRPQNYGMLTTILRPQGVHWHAVVFPGQPTPQRESWISIHQVREAPGWDKLYYKLNSWRDRVSIDDHDICSFLNDDDAVPPGFYAEVRQSSAPIVVTSMLRGQQTPKRADKGVSHPITPMIGSPGNMRINYVGVEQFHVKGRIAKHIHFPNKPDADGRVMRWLRRAFPDHIEYMPWLFVWFNYFEPGRWNRGPYDLPEGYQ